MPGNILNADTGFPRFQEGQSNSDKINVIMNYLYMLLEQLRYSMGNLDEKNFSPDGLEQLQKVITEPVYIELQNEDGKIANIAVTADGITARLNNMYVTPFSDQETYDVGACVLYDGSVWRCIEAVTTAGAWDASKWEECEAGSVETQLTITNQNVNSKIDGPGAQSLINQTLAGVTIQVLNENTGDYSQVGTYASGVLIMSTGQITNAGVVVFTPNDPEDLSEGYSMINGGTIKSQTIEASSIDSSLIRGSYIFGEHGIYGPRMITRKKVNQVNQTRYFQQVMMGGNDANNNNYDGQISFGIFRRSTDDPFWDGYDLSDATVNNGTLDEFGKIYAWYNTGTSPVTKKFYVTSRGDAELKLESSGDTSYDATLTGQPTPGYDNGKGGRMFIGTETYTIPVPGIGDRVYGQQVRIGGVNGQVIIFSGNRLSGIQAAPGTGIWEFLDDGIYYNGVKKVSV